LVAGILSIIALNSMNFLGRISTINTIVDSFDPKQVKTIELRTSISVIQNSVIKELNSLMIYSQTLNALPIYFILSGILFIIISSVLYLVILEETDPTQI
jgi:hypothetical protein